MTSNESPVRIGIIGAGLIGHRHIKHVVEEPSCILSGVVTRTLKAKDLVENAGATHYTDINTFLKESDAEAVIIATPNDTHARIGIQCARAGLHMLVEKPIDSDLKAAAGLIKAAEKAGVKLLIGHHRRFNPYIEAAKKILDEGSMGKIAAVNALWTVLKPPSYFDVTWRREPGGGPILINLIHDMDNLRYLFGDIERIYAESSSAIRGFVVEDTAVITIRFRNGILGCITTSDAVASPYNFESATAENPLIYSIAPDCYRIFGTKATLNFPEMTLWRYTGEGEQGWGDPISNERIGVVRTVPLVNQLRHFCDVVRHNAPPRCSGDEGLKTLEATMGVIESMHNIAPVMFKSAY